LSLFDLSPGQERHGRREETAGDAARAERRYVEGRHADMRAAPMPDAAWRDERVRSEVRAVSRVVNVRALRCGRAAMIVYGENGD